MNTFLKGMVKLTTPDSLSFLEESRRLFTVQEFKDSEKLKQKIKPGDIIITKTPSTVHGMVRKLTKSEFDHVSVFLNPNSVIHIAPPNVRVISSNIFLMKKYQSIILRPNLSPQENKQFLEKLMNTEHDVYDYHAILKIVGLKVLNNFINLNKYPNIKNSSLTERKICSDLIIYSLAITSPKFQTILRDNIQYLDFSNYGDFTPDDFIMLYDKDPSMFEGIQINKQQIEAVKRVKTNAFIKNELQELENQRLQQEKLEKTDGLENEFRLKQKQSQQFSQQFFGSTTDTADLVFVTLKIIYHLYQLKLIVKNYDTFMTKKSKFVLHFGSLMLLLNSISNPDSNELSLLSRIALPKL